MHYRTTVSIGDADVPATVHFERQEADPDVGILCEYVEIDRIELDDGTSCEPTTRQEEALEHEIMDWLDFGPDELEPQWEDYQCQP